MKKKLSFTLALAMVLSLAACGGNNAPASTTAATTTAAATTTKAAETTTEATTTTTAAETEAAPAPVEAEAITAEPLLYLGFESADGLTAMEQVEDKGDLTGAKFGLAPSDHAILIAEGQGAVGNALYLDGKYGVDFEMPQTDESYTFSFWFNADRVSTYGPVVQIGRNIGMSNADATVTWLNITKTTWGSNDADIFPVGWNRNSSIGTEVSADGVWPWIYAMDDQEHGKREWCNLTIVANGNRYVADDGMERVETKFYLNGELKWEANAENMYYQGLAPEILTGDGIEGHIGINYWDTIYKGFIDELYVFDDVLTDGQVKTLFEMGNPPEKPVAPEAGAVEEPEPEPVVLPPITPDASAVAVLGNTDRQLGWWTDHSDGYELADGKSLKFNLNNYSDGAENWHNFVIAFSNTPVKADVIPSADNYEGYAEYAVIRADAYGWGDADYSASFETSWTDFAGWLSRMTCANAEIVCTRNGGEVTIDITFHFADSGVETEKVVFTSAMTADSPVYVHIGGESAYIELLSVE